MAKNYRDNAPSRSPVRATDAQAVATPPTDIARRVSPKPIARTGWERATIRMAKLVGSLQVAVVLLLTFVVVMIIGTMAESYYNAKLAQDLVYHTWWFYLLMAGLALNIFFAAAKKFPWKRHQTGFVITHIGLELMIIGGVINTIWGVDSLMVLVSQPTDQAVREGLKQTSNMALSPDESVIEVTWPEKYGPNVTRRYPFSPGMVSWASSEKDDFTLKLDPMVEGLSWITHPLPRSWSADLGYGAKLEVENFYAHARPESFRAATRKDRKSEDAKKICLATYVSLTNPKINQETSLWLATDTPRRSYELIGGVAVVELMSRQPATPLQVEEFRNPPINSGPMGQLVIFFDEKPYRFEVDRFLNQPAVPLADGWSVKIVGYYPDGDTQKPFTASDNHAERIPVNPWVRLELIPPLATQSPNVIDVGARIDAGTAVRLDPKLAARVQVWYHVPDYRYGLSQQIRGVLQLLPAESGLLYYRSFHVADGVFKMESSGRVNVDGDPVKIWGKMEWALRIPKYLPEALVTMQPENKRPGLDSREHTQAILARLTVDGESKEFWLAKAKPGLPDKSSTLQNAGEGDMRIRFTERTEKLPFDVTLLRAEETTDPGSSSAASYSSFVMVSDKRNETLPDQEHYITMNSPLYYDGYKFFQTGMNTKSLDPDRDTLRPVAISTFTVSADPGLFLKYLGSILLAVGIATMFYMRAYFVKRPTPRPTTEPPTPTTA